MARPMTGNDTDAQTPEGLLRAFYVGNSGPAGMRHDWSRFRSLFLAEARLVNVSRDASGYAIGVRTEGGLKAPIRCNPNRKPP